MSAASRFDTPRVQAPAPLRLPAIERSTLANGLRVWTLPHNSLPVVALSVLIDVGTADDPATLPGLTALTIDMLDEGADGLDAIQFAERLGDLGATCDLGASPDASSALLWTLATQLEPALRLVASALMRPRLADADLARVRDLRLSRLQQARRSGAAMADRALTSAIYVAHGYGHGGLGTTAALTRATIDDVRAQYQRYVGSNRTTIVAAGAVPHDALVRVVEQCFGAWAPIPAVARAFAAPPAPAPRVLFVEREDAPQSEIRVGHLAPARATPDYHALLLLNAGLGGSFSGRLNQRLRQQLGYTYGARSAFDFDRDAGMFLCDSSVQADKTADSVREIHALLAAVRGTAPLDGDELELARGSLTLGYARGFETPRQLAAGLAQLVAYGLPDDVFDRFVPTITALTAADVARAAEIHVQPSQLTTVVVGDARWRDALGDGVETVQPEF